MKKEVGMVLVGIIMGSNSDLSIMREAATILNSFSVPNELKVVSAHRTVKRMIEYATHAHERGIKVIIAGAGGSAHLPGMVAAITPLPVIGVPVKTSTLSGLDSLMSIVQMPPGVPVATVAINGGRNAGLLACRILGIRYSRIAKLMDIFKGEMEASILKKAENLDRLGYESYVDSKST
jgi:5-(carboxyamino)imidazole ribonucleotide mutase